MPSTSPPPVPGIYTGRVLTVERRAKEFYITARCEGIPDLVEIHFPFTVMTHGMKFRVDRKLTVTVHADGTNEVNLLDEQT
jgi:hypothetical protein